MATGHTADDQAETVLHRLLRGTGLKGLGGIPARRPLCQGVKVVRPLLQVTRQEVLAYLRASARHSGRTVPTPIRVSCATAFVMNCCRLLARDYNPAVVEALCRLSEQARDVQQREETLARELLLRAELPCAGRLLVFDAALVLRSAERHTVREMFRLVWSARTGRNWVWAFGSGSESPTWSAG